MNRSNIILNTDSYKASHFLQYPPGSTALYSYVESRGGTYASTVFFGLQAFLKAYFSVPVTHDDIDEAEDFWAAHGEPFNRGGWERIVNKFGGYLPLRIRAVAEGTVVPTSNALATVESTDPATFWIASYLETALLRAIWYPTTVATISRQIKKTIGRYLNETGSDAASQLPFKLHDFGARGVSSEESAQLGGLAHLVNFSGTDNVSAVLAARRYYAEPMAAYSIPAAEHSTITAWGRDGELDAYRNMLTQFAKPGRVVAIVSDSYDLYTAIDTLWGQHLRAAVIASGATVVIRPDSGRPVDVVLRSAVLLDQAFGTTTNAKGYKVLNHVRLIQGDGVNAQSIADILAVLKANGYAAENIAFGLGGGLLQQLDRDTQRFAMKTSAIEVNGAWRDVYKQPVTDLGKQSKRGRLTLYYNASTGCYRTDLRDPDTNAVHDNAMRNNTEWREVLVDVWENGRLLCDWTLSQVRARADLGTAA
jgi:nicotinamide phosphoribosyltransferase